MAVIKGTVSQVDFRQSVEASKRRGNALASPIWKGRVISDTGENIAESTTGELSIIWRFDGVGCHSGDLMRLVPIAVRQRVVGVGSEIQHEFLW